MTKGYYVNINVTKEIIQSSDHTCNNCPIHNALTEQNNSIKQASVFTSKLLCFYNGNYVRMRLPNKLRNIIRKYDETKIMLPFKYRLRIVHFYQWQE